MWRGARDGRDWNTSPVHSPLVPSLQIMSNLFLVFRSKIGKNGKTAPRRLKTRRELLTGTVTIAKRTSVTDGLASILWRAAIDVKLTSVENTLVHLLVNIADANNSSFHNAVSAGERDARESGLDRRADALPSAAGQRYDLLMVLYLLTVPLILNVTSDGITFQLVKTAASPRRRGHPVAGSRARRRGLVHGKDVKPPRAAFGVSPGVRRYGVLHSAQLNGRRLSSGTFENTLLLMRRGRRYCLHGIASGCYETGPSYGRSRYNRKHCVPRKANVSAKLDLHRSAASN
ncbi:hypothetical protein EVAR_39509_1 [Eumeta japonica]|uniref:Uncharacterized protein n=1 Tax=Eumeta variegata TaxID=151549 RepID=A0A4C1VZM9_EUMVA|nr:hypothetical protein EVAR_39509_1 [Eumeta japonica]